MIDDSKLKEVLLSGSYITSDDADRIEKRASSGGSFAELLLSEGLITRDLLGQAVAEYFHVPYADLNSNPPSPEDIIKIPENVAKKLHVVFVSADTKGVTVATDSPDNPDLIRELKELFSGKKIIVSYSLAEDIDALFVNYRTSLATRFSQILKKETKVAPEIIEEIFEDALLFRASDIHLEPGEKEVVVRFRVDGILHEAGRIPKDFYESMLNRIKVRAHLRIDEHFSAQDGAIRHEAKQGSVDMRISIVPTLDGEKVAIRLLSEYVRGFTMTDLGLSLADQEILSASARKPYGMILTTGPTGSGKTTTLYALLKILNSPEVNITTIEDPVEYKITGVNHIQVNPDTNLTFAKGLRSIIRQDPNIILVGEIRDTETAEIAVNAALTGHLLLSTFHANDAATAIPRLLDMDVEPFLLASTLNLVIAQRLVRKICEQCRYSVTVPLAELKKQFSEAPKYFSEKAVTIYRGKGCSSCNGSGYKGRTALFELLPISSKIRDLILSRPSAQTLWREAQAEGAHSLFDDGILKVKEGVTTVEEILRVARALE